MKTLSPLFLLLFLFPLSLTAEEDRLIWLPFGEGRAELGAELEDGEEWFPVLFALDTAGSVHVPDFFKGRIAVYDRDGSFLREVPAPDLVSPRMNLFGLGRDGSYYSFVDFAFSSVDATGKLRWSLAFSMGTILEGAVATDDAVYLVVSSETGQASLRVPNSADVPEVFTLYRKVASGTGAPVRNAAGHEYCFRLSDELVSGKPIRGLADDDAIDRFDLAFLGREGRTVWIALDSRGYSVMVVGADRRVTDRFFLDKARLNGTRSFRIYSVASPELLALSGGSPKRGLGILTVEQVGR